MSMTMVKAEKVYRASGNWYLAYITSTEEPANGNITGADVDGCSNDIQFAAGSVIDYPSGKYEAFEDGLFSMKG